MYHITKLSQASQTLIADISGSNKSRALPVSITLARLLANRLPLPTSEVECIDTFYNAQHAVAALTRLSSLNELLLLDTATIVDLIKRFYRLRYQQVCPQDHVLMRPQTAVLDFFRVTKSVDETTITCIYENATYIMELTTRFIDLLNELKEETV